METQYADVWIIGSGAAGLMAGIAAAGAGARVGVIGKGAPGEGSATERAGGAFAGAWQGLGIEEQVERTMQSGRGINSLDLVRAFAADGPKRFQDLIDWGMPYRNTRGALRVLPPKGELGEIPMWSAEITRSLAARAGGLGVSFQNHTVVGKIEAGEAGVRLVAFGSEGPMELIGGAAVIAAGGAGGIYQHNDNPPGITGNAHALGLAAGAELRDMEFMQFYPMTINEPGKARLLFEPDEANQGRVLNDKGEDILDKYDITERPAARHARDRTSQALFQEMELEGNEVFIDLTHLDREAWLGHNLSPVRFDLFDRRYDAFGQPIRLSPVAHFSVGGLCINAHGATTVGGLYAAGEAAGGVHGANRMGGNSLAETVVFGHRAGLAAAAWAEGRGQGREMTKGAPPAQPGDGAIDGARLFEDLRQVMWLHAGIRRDAAGLAAGLARVLGIKAQAGQGGDQLVELRLASQTAELIIEAAIRREESRGAHYRVDFPATDDANWRGNLCVQRQGDSLEWRYDAIEASPG